MSSDSKAAKGHGWIVAALCIFTLVGLVLNVQWILDDQRPTTYDDSWHLETSYDLYHRLAEDGIGAFLNAYIEAFRVKAPLIAILPLPFFAVMGLSLDSALMVNCIFLVIINAYLFKLSRLWFSPETGLLAVIVYQSLPITIGMSRAFMTEYGLVAFVIAFVFYLVEFRRCRTQAMAIKLGLVVGLGLLMKINFLIVAGPLVIVLAKLHREDELSAARRPLAVAAGCAALVAGPWYLVNGPRLLAFTWSVSLGGIENYQVADRVVWLERAATVALSSYYSWGLLLVGLAFVASAGRPRAPSERALVLMSWALPGALLAWLGAHQDYRYILVLLPPFAISLADGSRRLLGRLIHDRLLLAVACLMLLAPALLGYLALSVKAEWLAPFHRPAGWARLADDHGAWRQERLVEEARTVALRQGRSNKVVVGIEHPFLNSTLLNCLDARDGGQLEFYTLAFGTADDALVRVHELDPGVIILAEGFADAELESFLNLPNESLRRAVVGGELPYRRHKTISLTAHRAGVLFMKREGSAAPQSP